MKIIQLGKIYRIVCHVIEEVYVWSTCVPTLAKRLVAHRFACTSFHKKTNGACCASFQICLRGDYYIKLIKYIVYVIILRNCDKKSEIGIKELNLLIKSVI